MKVILLLGLIVIVLNELIFIDDGKDQKTKK